MKAPGRAKDRGAGPLLSLAVFTTLWSFGVAISEPFLNAYLWSLGSSWVAIGIFNLAQYAAMVLAFPAAGWLAKRVEPRLPLRLAVLAVAAVFALVLRLGIGAARHVFGLGLLLGVGWALFWLSEFVYSFDLTEHGGRDRWQAELGLLETAAALVAPLLAGAIIGTTSRLTGYRWLFAAALTLLASAFAATWRLPGGASSSRYRIAAALPTRRAPRPWCFVLLAQAALGLRDGVYLFAPALLVYTLSRSALDLGIYLTATQLVSLAAYAGSARWGRPQLRRPMLLAGSVASMAAALILGAGFDVPAVWAFGLVTAALQPLLQVPLEACTLDVMALHADAAVRRIEFTVVKEMVVGTGRTASVAALTLVVAHAGAGAIRGWLEGVALLPIIAWLALRRFPALVP